MVGASAMQPVYLGFISLLESYQKTLTDDIHIFPAWQSARKGERRTQDGKFAKCVLGKGA